jgi:hypothetical protein
VPVARRLAPEVDPVVGGLEAEDPAGADPEPASKKVDPSNIYRLEGDKATLVNKRLPVLGPEHSLQMCEPQIGKLQRVTQFYDKQFFFS